MDNVEAVGAVFLASLSDEVSFVKAKRVQPRPILHVLAIRPNLVTNNVVMMGNKQTDRQDLLL